MPEHKAMKAKPEKIERLIEQIDELVDAAGDLEKEYESQIADAHPSFRRSAANLVHYRAIRQHDIRDLQTRLGHLGLTRLARAQGHMLASLLNTRSILQAMIRNKPVEFDDGFVSIKRAEKLLRSHTKALFGNRSKGRRVRIMVTLASDAAQDYQLVHDLVSAGMNSARINCAHDGPDVWLAMIENVRRASEQLRRKVKICMDLGGPKIRTGPIRPGPRVASYSPRRDALGRVTGPGVVWLAPPETECPEEADTHIPVSAAWVDGTAEGDEIFFIDTRGKRRKLEVVRKEAAGCWANGYDRSFVITGSTLHRNEWDAEGEPVGLIPPKEERLLLRVGDILILHRDPSDGEPAELDQDGNVTQPAHVSCTNHDVFHSVQVGAKVRFDDGKIEGKVLSVETGERLEIGITYTKAEGQRLAADKGVNFPDTRLQLSGLTAKDREDLEFVVAHADVVNMSFVNSPKDVEDLIDEIERLGARDRIGVVLKIETQAGFNNLTEILLTAMRVHPVGVMIARGDLAVETGWENMALIQEEILGLCGAAHVPEVWATQVLENLAKKGLPSRAEVTDAASSLQAECVMLNKGPHIVRAVSMLDTILKTMRDYRHEKAPMLPPLTMAE